MKSLRELPHRLPTRPAAPWRRHGSATAGPSAGPSTGPGVSGREEGGGGASGIGGAGAPPRRLIRRAHSTTPSARGAATAHRIGVPLMHSLWHVSIYGVENVPATGAVILAGNHTSFLDGPLIVGVSPRPVHFLVKQEVFVGPLGPILHGLGQIPVDRKHPDRTAIQASLAALRAGNVLGVFPEGTRTAGEFEQVHNGLAYFALSTGAPVVPVACLGTAVNGKTVGSLPAPRTHLDLVYGPPVSLAELSAGTEGLGRRQKIAAISEELRVRLAAHVAEAKRMTGRE